MASPLHRNSTPATFGHRRPVRLPAEEGFTLIEVMASALIVVLIAAGVAQALIATTHFSGVQRFRAQADAVAQQDEERMKGLSDQQLDNLDQTRTVTEDGTQFTVHSTATFVDAAGGSSCQSGTAAYYKLTSTAGWTDASRTDSITEEAVITRAVTGALLQQVEDQTASPLPGVNVSVAGQSTNYQTTGVTDSNGCTLITGLPTDSYGITLADRGYVDKDGNASPPNLSVAVTQNSVARSSEQMIGLGGTMTAGFATVGNGGTVYTQAPGFDLSYYGNLGGTHMSAAKVAGSVSSPATSVTVGSLFPFYSTTNASYGGNYQVWAGKCAEEQPLQPPTLNGTLTDGATVTPGATGVPALLVEPSIDALTKYNGVVETPTHVHVTFKNTAGSCTDAWTNVAAVGSEQVSNVTYNVYPAPFSSNAAQGSATASANGGTGTVTFCADYKYQSSPAAYRYETWTGTTSNFSGPNATLSWDLKTDRAAVTNTTGCP